MSDLTICNSALIRLGVDPISSLSDNNKPARLCNEQYNKVRKVLLAEHNWNFATKRATLTPTVAVPAYEFSFTYDLPVDFLRFISPQYPSECDSVVDYQIEDGKILSNFSTFNFKYIYDVTNTDKFSASFAELLSLKLAINLSFSLNQSTALLNSLRQEYEVVLRDARSIDGQENPAYQIVQDTFLNSRY